LRERYGFRTTLSTAELVRVVRGHCVGRSDADVVTDLSVKPKTVAWARINLHLFRLEDTGAPFVRELLRRLDAGDTPEAAAATLDISPSMAARYAHVLRVHAEAQRSGLRYPEEFEELLALDIERLGRTYRTDRRTIDTRSAPATGMIEGETDARTARPRRVKSVGQFETLLAEHDRLLVEFYTENCSMCGAMEPVLGTVAKVTDTPIALVNGSDLFALTSEYRIGSVPSLLLFKGGEEVDRLADRFVGADGVLEFLGEDPDGV
jgi:thiol-disulfide isomerase/thioredoxin